MFHPPLSLPPRRLQRLQASFQASRTPRRFSIPANNVTYQMRLGRPPKMRKTVLVCPATSVRGAPQLRLHHGRLRRRPPTNRSPFQTSHVMVSFGPSPDAPDALQQTLSSGIQRIAGSPVTQPRRIHRLPGQPTPHTTLPRWRRPT